MVTRWSIAITTSAIHNDQETLIEMHVATKELLRFNQTLEENVLALYERYHEDFPIEDGVLNPQHLLDEIWGAQVLENFQSLSLAKSDGNDDI